MGFTVNVAISRSCATELTWQEEEVLACFVEGQSADRIASHLKITPTEARRKCRKSLVKLGLGSLLMARELAEGLFFYELCSTGSL
ncbi:MAG: hypothetical protein MPJ24_10980, partial [Pirellulaceae bacterium]|nr:hypothetical protein [Pirellulaceae bacterium]